MKLRLNNRTARDDLDFSSGFSPQLHGRAKQSTICYSRRSVLLVLLLAWYPLLSSAVVSAQVPTKRVLIISGYDPTRPAFIMINRAIRSTIMDGVQGPVEFFNEFQDNTWLSNHKYETEMVSYLRQKYAGEEINLIIALGTPALEMLLENESTLFTGIPKIFYFHDATDKAVTNASPYVTGVWSKVGVKETLQLAQTLHPDSKNVVVVSGNSVPDKFLREETEKEFRAYQDKFSFTYVNDVTIEELKSTLATLPGNTVVLFLSFFRDRTGHSFTGPEALSQVAASSSAPIYGIAETYLGFGIVGGSLLDFEALGRRTGEVSLRVMAGEKPQNIPPQIVPTVTLFDRRELQRWGISEQRIPAGSVVKFRQPTLWELYKWYIIGIIAASLMQTALIVWLLLLRAKRRQAESESQRLGEVAGAEHKRLQEVVANVPGIVWESRLDTVTREPKAAFASDYAEKMLGYSPQELTSEPRFASTIIHEGDRERVLREFHEVRAGKPGDVIQYRCRAKDGRIVWVESTLAPIVDQSGAIVGVRSVTLDITSLKAAEEAQGQSEERSGAILQAIPDLMFLQTRDGVYLDYNAKNQGELLVHPEHFLGKNMRDVLPPQLADQFFRCFERAEKGETQLLEYQLPIGGMPRWYEARVVLSGENVLSVVRDITERKESEEALRTAHYELSTLKSQLEAENVYLQHELHMNQSESEILGKSDAIQYVLFKISQVAPTDSTVLITGETGTGKELVARAIHAASRRKDRPLVKVNCAALSPTLIESELFGHEKGAFTGADTRKLGRFELAKTGTLFLDEIGELPLELQVKLLRVLQEGEFERLGGTKTLEADVRIIAATNRNLKLEVAKGNFREDLWYRLNVFPITLPPLRTRKEDIPVLVNHFVKRAAKKTGKTITSVSAVTMRSLQEHSWPGNIRELANVLERAVIHAVGSSLQVVDRFEQITQEPTTPKTLDELEREYILSTLESTGWRIEGADGAAKVLGLNASTLRTRMLKLGIQRRQATHN